MKIAKLVTSSYQPQTNGKAERFVRYLNSALSLICDDKKSDWDDLLDFCLFAHRILVIKSLDESPFYLLYGRDAVLPCDLVLGLPNNQEDYSFEDMMNYKINLTNNLRSAYDNLLKQRDKYQSKYKAYYDKSHKDVEYKAGDKVMVYWPVKKEGIPMKLLPKWDGPFTISEKLGPVTYRIVKPLTPTTERTFTIHVQRLKKF